MKIVLSHWKDRESHGIKLFRNAHLRDKRSWTLWVGKHCLSVHIHGAGPIP